MLVLTRLRTSVHAYRLRRASTDPAIAFRASLMRRNKLMSLLATALPLVRTLLLLAGVVYTLLLPWKGLGRGHYISENALQPGQVNTYWNWADVHVADKYAEEVDKWALLDGPNRSEAIRTAFSKLGLPTATQPYSFQVGGGTNNSTSQGTNVYSIYAAPKTDGAEALVLSASWLSRAVDEHAQSVVNTRGVAIVLALANYLKKSSYWSKDIIFLISDGYTDGAVAWLDAYHGYGQTNLVTGPLPLSTGPIWAALSIDYPYHSFSHVGLFFDGVNGHLPNLDYVNSASHILKHSAIPPILHGDLSVAHLQRTALAGISKRFDTDGARLFMRSAKQLWRQLAAGASGGPSGPEGVYGRYRIDAITMFAIPAEGPHGFHALGRAVESTFRSLNNLLERFHQSFFLYIMTSVESFITVGNYLAAPILISASLTFSALIEWFQIGRSHGQLTPPRHPVGTALAIMGLTHGLGAALLAGLGQIDTNRPLWHYLPSMLGLSIALGPLVIVNLVALSPTRPAAHRDRARWLTSLSSTLRATTLMLAGLTIAVVATLNFGAAVFLSLLLPLPLLLPRRFSHSRSSRWTHLLAPRVQQLLITACSPPVIWTLCQGLGGERGARAANEWALRALRDWRVAGSWSVPFVCCIVVPLLLQSATSVLL